MTSYFFSFLTCVEIVYAIHIFTGLFQAISEGEESSVQFYNDWIEDVENSVEKDRLLVFRVQDGWEPLCKFLNVSLAPKEAFPHVNDTASFQLMYAVAEILAWILVCCLPIFLCALIIALFTMFSL